MSEHIGGASTPQHDPAQAMQDLIDAFKRARFPNGVPFGARIRTNAMSLWESLYDELSLHLSEMPVAQRIELAEQLVMRAQRDWGDPDG